MFQSSGFDSVTQGFQSENDRNLHFTKFIDGTEIALHRACSKSLPPGSECSIWLQEILSSRDPLVRFAQPTIDHAFTSFSQSDLGLCRHEMHDKN